jgi:hypothetical protein
MHKRRGDGFSYFIFFCSVILFYLFNVKPRVLAVLRVPLDTTPITVRYVPLPDAGTVSAGVGVVWEMLTRGIPVRKPNAISTSVN